MKLTLKLNQPGLPSVRKLGVIVLVVCLTAAVFAYDCLTPRGVEGTFWYFLPIFLSGQVGWRDFSYWLAGLITVFAGLALYLMPPGVDFQIALVNRLMFLAVLWMMAALITRRKAAEQALRRSQRVLRTLSDCNQALVRATAEDELLRDICRVIVEQGGYRMAWVGFAENDAKKSVRIAARAGQDEGYLAQANINWDETSEYGCGPTGTAIRTGRIAVNQDYQTDPAVAPWRAEALKRGYASSIVLPLRSGEDNFGVLTMYGGEANAFNSTEVHVLKELADDLAYGIRTLRARLTAGRAEAVLRDSEERFRKIFEEAPLGIVMASPVDNRFIRANAAVCEMLGYTEAELQRLTFVDVTHPDYRAQDLEAVKRMRAGEIKKSLVEKQYLKQNGEVVWGMRALTGIANAAGELVCDLAMIEDITARKRAEDLLRQRAEELRAQNDELTRFNRVAVGRELRMIELKREINELCGRLGEPPRHKIAEAPEPPPATPGA